MNFTQEQLKKMLRQAGTSDPVLREILDKIDYLENEMYESNIPPCKYIELRAKYDILIEIRDLIYANS